MRFGDPESHFCYTIQRVEDLDISDALIKCALPVIHTFHVVIIRLGAHPLNSMLLFACFIGKRLINLAISELGHYSVEHVNIFFIDDLELFARLIAEHPLIFNTLFILIKNLACMVSYLFYIIHPLEHDSEMI